MKRLLFPALLLSACAATPAPDPTPNVVLDTEAGEIEIEVYPDAAPLSAGDFLRYVDDGLYDGEAFYRTVRADNDPRGMNMSLIQGGRRDQEPVHPPVAHERTTDTGISNTRGAVALARLEPGTGSAAWFFINIGDNSFLDTGGARNPDGEGYATFGRVVRGMDVVETIQAGRSEAPSDEAVTSGQILDEPVTITRAYRVAE